MYVFTCSRHSPLLRPGHLLHCPLCGHGGGARTVPGADLARDWPALPCPALQRVQGQVSEAEVAALCREACAAGRPPGRGPCCPPHPAAALDQWPLSFRSGPSCSSRRSVGGHGVARLCAGLARACRAWAAGQHGLLMITAGCTAQWLLNRAQPGPAARRRHPSVF